MARRFNQIGLKDLFVTNPSDLMIKCNFKKRNSDSAIDGSSQENSTFQHSQMELFDSQDAQILQSQNFSQSSPGNRVYNRYMSKAPIFSRENSDNSQRNQMPQLQQPQQFPGVARKLPNQQQIQMMKAKQQELDERDLWNNLVTSVCDCSAEIRSAVHSIKENSQLNISSTENTLTKFLEKFQADLERGNKGVMDALYLIDSKKEQELKLRQELALKEARIVDLEAEVEHLRNNNKEAIVDQMQTICIGQHQQTKNCLGQMLEGQQQQLMVMFDTQNLHHKITMDQTKNLFQQESSDRHKMIRDLQNRFESEISEQFEQLNGQQREFKIELDQMLKDIQASQRDEVNTLLARQMDQLSSSSERRQRELFDEHQKQMETLQQQHKATVQNYVNAQLILERHGQAEMIQALVEDFCAKEMLRSFSLQNTQQKKFEDEIQKNYEKELQDLKDRHNREVTKLLEVIQTDAMKSNDARQFETFVSDPVKEMTRADNLPAGSLFPVVRPATMWNQSDQSKRKVAYIGAMAVVNSDEQESRNRGSLDCRTINNDASDDVRDGRSRNFVVNANQSRFTERPFLSPLLPETRNNSFSMFGKSDVNPSPVATVLPLVVTTDNSSKQVEMSTRTSDGPPAKVYMLRGKTNDMSSAKSGETSGLKKQGLASLVPSSVNQSIAPPPQLTVPTPKSTAPPPQSTAPPKSTAPPPRSTAPPPKSTAPPQSTAPPLKSTAPPPQSTAPPKSTAPPPRSTAPPPQSSAPPQSTMRTKSAGRKRKNQNGRNEFGGWRKRRVMDCKNKRNGRKAMEPDTVQEDIGTGKGRLFGRELGNNNDAVEDHVSEGDKDEDFFDWGFMDDCQEDFKSDLPEPRLEQTKRLLSPISRFDMIRKQQDSDCQSTASSSPSFSVTEFLNSKVFMAK